MSRARLVSRSERVYRALLRVHPAAFRREYGERTLRGRFAETRATTPERLLT